jgi:hypothetical protein
MLSVAEWDALTVFWKILEVSLQLLHEYLLTICIQRYHMLFNSTYHMKRPQLFAMWSPLLKQWPRSGRNTYTTTLPQLPLSNVVWINWRFTGTVLIWCQHTFLQWVSNHLCFHFTWSHKSPVVHPSMKLDWYTEKCHINWNGRRRFLSTRYTPFSSFSSFLVVLFKYGDKSTPCLLSFKLIALSLKQHPNQCLYLHLKPIHSHSCMQLISLDLAPFDQHAVPSAPQKLKWTLTSMMYKNVIAA